MIRKQFSNLQKEALPEKSNKDKYFRNCPQAKGSNHNWSNLQDWILVTSDLRIADITYNVNKPFSNLMPS